MTIRAKLIAAIALTVLGPVVTIGVALVGFEALGDRFDEVQRHAAGQRRALELKFAVTDMNGWQTAYGYDRGRSRARFAAAAGRTQRLIAAARRDLTGPRERALLGRLEAAYGQFMALDRDAWQALEAGREEETRRILLGPEITHFRAMARAAQALADEQDRGVAAAARAFDEERRDARRQIVAVAIGAGVVIVLLLVTAQDVARQALEGRRGPGAA